MRLVLRLLKGLLKAFKGLFVKAFKGLRDSYPFVKACFRDSYMKLSHLLLFLKKAKQKIPIEFPFLVPMVPF